MRNKITTEQLINDLLPTQVAEQVYKNVAEEVSKWGGKREGAGRRTKTGTTLKITVRLSENEKRFIEYARDHNINLEKLIQG